MRVSWYGHACFRLEGAGVSVITDPYSDPLLDARQALGANYGSVLRINSLACGWHPDSRDHNGNQAHALLARLGLKPASFDDYLAALKKFIAGNLDTLDTLEISLEKINPGPRWKRWDGRGVPGS
jgi:hypothetical protein